MDNSPSVKDNEPYNNKTPTQLREAFKLTEIKIQHSQSVILDQNENSVLSKDETNNLPKEDSDPKRKLNYFFKPGTSSRLKVDIKNNSEIFQNSIVSKNSFLFSPDKVTRKSPMKEQNMRNKNDEKLQLSMTAVENYMKF